jgi:hypothetical protein
MSDSCRVSSKEFKSCLKLPLTEVDPDEWNALGGSLASSNSIVTFSLFRNKNVKQGYSVAEMISKNTSIQSLNLSNNGIEEDGLVSIARALEDNSSIQTLDVSQNQINDNDSIAIACMLQKNQSLQVLNVSKSKCSLQDLDLSHDQMNEKACVQLAEALSANKIAKAECCLESNRRKGISYNHKSTQTKLFSIGSGRFRM